LWIVCLAVLTTLVTSCGEPAPGLVGIWKVNVSDVGGRNISDGKSFFHFKEDGSVDTRSAPGVFRSGTYTQDEAGKKITLKSGPNSSVYTYDINGDQLTMSGMLQNNAELKIQAVRVEQLPVTEAEEAHLTSPVMPPGSYSAEDSLLMDSLRSAAGDQQP